MRISMRESDYMADTWTMLKQKLGQAFDPMDARAERGNQVFVPEQPQKVVEAATMDRPRLSEAELQQRLEEVQKRYQLMAEQRRAAAEANEVQDPSLQGYQKFR